MIEVISSHGASITRRIIYEPGDLVPNGIKLVRYRDRFSAMRGEYVEDINGRFVPLLQRVRIKARDGYHFIFPGYCWATYRTDRFSWPVSTASVNSTPTRVLPPKAHLVLAMLSKGVDMNAVAARAWPGDTYKTRLRRLRHYFHNELFMTLFLEQTGYMNKLKEALLNRGINQERIGNEIADIIESGGRDARLRQWALEKAMEILDEEKKPKARSLLKELASEVSSAMADTLSADPVVLASLPPAIEDSPIIPSMLIESNSGFYTDKSSIGESSSS